MAKTKRGVPITKGNAKAVVTEEQLPTWELQGWTVNPSTRSVGETDSNPKEDDS